MLNSSFPRNITLLRKERGLSQKSVAAALGVSQALLSHYEKGIRECGLAFLVRIADFYGVTCDYLLGRAPRQAPAPAAPPADRQPSALSQALGALEAVLGLYEAEGIALRGEAYLAAAFYRLFRTLYDANAKNPPAAFALPEPSAQGFAQAQESRLLAELAALLSGAAAGGEKGVPKSSQPGLSPEKLAQALPQTGSALFTLLGKAEETFVPRLPEPPAPMA